MAGTARYAPLLTRVRRLPTARALQFDVNARPYDDLAATNVAARMLPLEDIVCHRLDAVPLDQLSVRDLAVRLRQDRLTRMPFLDGGNRIRMIVHRSMVDHYLAGKVTEAAGVVDISSITMADLLAEQPDLRTLFEAGFQVVAPSVRLSQVNAIVSGDRNVQDVFVTATGNRDEPILGWITNVMVAQHSQ